SPSEEWRDRSPRFRRPHHPEPVNREGAVAALTTSSASCLFRYLRGQAAGLSRAPSYPAAWGISSTSPGRPPRCTPGATGMTGRLFMLLALVVVIAAAWAALVTLFSPPLTLGGREFSEAMVRRWVRNVAVLGVGTVLVFVLWLLFLALRCSFSGRSCAS